jgi:hypothetical protein
MQHYNTTESRLHVQTMTKHNTTNNNKTQHLPAYRTVTSCGEMPANVATRNGTTVAAAAAASVHVSLVEAADGECCKVPVSHTFADAAASAAPESPKFSPAINLSKIKVSQCMCKDSM